MDADSSDQIRKMIILHKRSSYYLDDIGQSACLVINPIKVDNLLYSLVARR